MSNYREKTKLFKFSFGTAYLLLALSVLFALDTRTTFAQTCGVPGKDGSGTLNGVINTYFPAPISSSSASGTSIPVGAVSNSESALTSIAPGDLLLIIQMQDATINTSNNSNYGAGSGTGRGSTGGNAGFYEYARATNSVSTSGGTITVASALTRTYSNDPNATTTRGKQTYQVIRVPQYTSATISGTVSAATWDGRSGGVVVFDVAGNLAMGGGLITAAARGFRGGLGRDLSGGSGSNTDFRTLATNANNASKGEGIVGTQRYIWDNLLGIDTGVEGYPLGSYAQGAPGNAGGGGTDGDPGGNSENSGGGGGANGGNGGKGGNSWSSNLNNGGRGGAAFSATVRRITMGGGGGAGTSNNGSAATSSGARGGGIVLIRAGTISGSGTINVNGQNAANSNPSCCGDGSGGGGGGGSIIVTATVPSGISGISASARGGNGGSAAVADDLHGPGGGGGGGVIMSNASYGSTNVTGGANGTTPPTNVAYGAVSGDNGVVDTTVLPSSIDGTSSGSSCLPRITLTKVSNVDVGSFSFSGTNGFSNQSITTTVIGTGVAGSTQSLTAAETITEITEAIPSGWSLSSISCTGLGSGGTATSDLVAGKVTLNANATKAGSNIACTFTNAKRSPNLTIAKADTGNFTVGSTGTYQVTVGNSGTAATSGTITVTDTLPTGLTVANGALTLGGANSANWSCSAASNVITCTSSTAIATSGSSVFTFNVNVGTNAPVGTNSVSNTANVSGGGEAAANNGNNGSTDTTTVLSPNLTIAKSHTPATFVRGSTGTYNLTVGNSGTAATSGTVTVVDTLPAGLTIANGAVTLSGANAANWSCNAASNVITCSSTTAIATSGSSIFGFNVNVASNAAASVTNNVAVSGGNEATANNGNNSATDPTPTAAFPDLTITKSHTGNFTAGSTGTYSFTVNNTGAAASSGTITITDTLPTGMTVNGGSAGGITEGGANAANWTCTSNASSPQTVTCTSSTAIAASGSRVFNFAVSVGLGTAVGTNSVTNTANISGGGESNTSNNSSNDPTTILSPNLTIAKVDTGNFTVGSTGTYRITVGNSGTAATSGTITVTDTLPTGLTVANGALTLGGANSANWSCNAASNVITCTSSTAIATSGSSVFTFNVNVGTNAPVGTDSISNTANVSGGGEATANNGNNGSTDTTTVLSPNLTISKSHTPATFVRGSTGTYNLTVGNSGTAATSGTVTVVDTLPAGLTIANGAVTLSGANAANWSCNAASNVITCTSSTAIATSGSSTFGFVVNVASNAAASVTNNVAVSGGNEATANNGNNSATDPTPTAAFPDLTITKSHTGNFTAGSTGTYSFTVNNTGGTSSSGTITVTDTLPTGMTVANGAVTLGGTNSANWSCNAASNVITCTSSTAIAASGSSVFNFAVSVGLGTAVGTNSVTNTANVSGGGETNTSNNSSNDPTTILSPNLTIAKVDTGNFTVGSTGTYRITVGNSGTATTSGTITVTDTLPTGLTVANGALTLGGANSANWSCNAASNVITCTSSTAIATSGSSVFTFNVNVGTNAPVGTDSISNTANVSGGREATANNGNNGSTDTTTVLSPNLTIAKSHTPATFVRGSTGTYNLTVGNSGTAATSGTVTVVDTLPAGLTIANGAVTLSGANAANWSCNAASNVITCSSTTAIATSGSSTFGFVVNVASNAAASVTNNVAVSGGNEATANNGNNSATDPTPTAASADLTITKSHTGDFTVGATGTYSFSVNNTGGAASSGTITVTDTLPTGLTVNGGSAGGITEGGTNAANWTCTSNALSPQTVTCTSSTAIAVSGSSVFNFAVNVGATTAVGMASITNTANVSGGGEINTSNNSSSDPTTVLAPDLTISKTDSGNSFIVGSLGNYTFTVSNGGTAATSGTITVTDTLPAGLVVNGGTAGAVTLYGADASIWTCTSVSGAPQTITCTTTSVISVGSSSTFNFDVYVGPTTPTGGNSITNTASVSGGGEVNTANNSGSDSTTVIPEPAAPSPGTVCSLGTAVNLLSTAPFSAFQDANSIGNITSSIPLIANASNYRLGTGPGNRIIVDLSWGWNNGEPSNVSTESTYTLRINGTDYARITSERNPTGRVATVVGLNGASVSDSTILVDGYPPSNYQQSYVTLPVSVTQILSGSMVFASPGASPGDDIGFRISTIYACSPAVTVSKTSNGPWAIGQTGSEYTLTATNAGAATTFGTTTVRDVLPAGVTANWTGTRNVTNGGVNWACTFSGQNVSCTTSDGLSSVSGSNTSQITVPVNVTTATAIGTNSITNYASIGGGGDPTNSGNAPTPGSGCAPGGLCTSHQTTVNSSDLTIAKSHTGNFTRGAPGTYSISVGNGGTAATSGTITVSDSLPAGLSVPDGAVALTGTDAANWSCSAASNVITCTSTAVIAIGGSSSFSFNVNVSLTAASSVTNTVTVAGETEATVNNGNNSASDLTNLNANPPNVELEKSCPAPLNCTTAPQLPGTDLTYKIEFRNTGGRGAANLVLIDRIPENTDYKLGSAAANAGTTGLVFAIEFSSDYDPLNPTFATWGYSPVSGGGGAIAGYDRNVKAIRWRVTSGTLSNVSPDNIGDISFGTRIR